MTYIRTIIEDQLRSVLEKNMFFPVSFSPSQIIFRLDANGDDDAESRDIVAKISNLMLITNLLSLSSNLFSKFTLQLGYH